jgi:hypothetical protein
MVLSTGFSPAFFNGLMIAVLAFLHMHRVLKIPHIKTMYPLDRTSRARTVLT